MKDNVCATRDSFAVVRASIVNEEPTSPCKGEFDYELELYGGKPPYKLHITIGDPDSGDAVQFEKRHQAASLSSWVPGDKFPSYP
jgi:hypothetical protein